MENDVTFHLVPHLTLLRLEGDKEEEDPNSTTTKIAFKKSALGTSSSTSVACAIGPSVTTILN